MALRRSIIEYAGSLEPDGFFTIEQLRDEMIAREGHGFRENSLLTLVEDMCYMRKLVELPGKRYCLRKKTQDDLERVAALAEAEMAVDPRFDYIRVEREYSRRRKLRLIERGIISPTILEDIYPIPETECAAG